jgi:hypothetical protein
MTSDSALYLYAIVPSAIDLDDLHGMNGAPVGLVDDGDIAAVVSSIGNEKIRPQRKNLASHQHILKSLVSITTPLPIKFGVIAENKVALKKMLEGYHDSLAEQLEYLHGTVEMGLHLNWNAPNIFEYIVNSHSELKAMREKVLSSNSLASRDDMIEIGYRFSQTLEGERQRHASTIQTTLTDCCLDTKTNSLRKESEVVSLSCLVSKDKLPEFEKAIYDMANLFNDDFGLNYNGPWAPHNFVDIHIDSLDTEG